MCPNRQGEVMNAGPLTYVREHPVPSVLVLAALIESVTCVLRFGFRLRTAVHTSWLAPLTFGFRIHHGYIGLLLVAAAALLLPRGGAWRLPGVVSGLAIVLSDVAHHLVLWAVTGSPELVLKYPG
jgi:hypothetical protein